MTDTIPETRVDTHVPGQRYRINTEHPNSAVLDPGETVQIIRLDAGAMDLWVVQRVDEDDVPSGREWYVSQRYLDPLDAEPDVLIPATVPLAEHEALQRRLAEVETVARADRDRLGGWQRSALSDASIIADVLNEEAESRDWCEDYDSIVARINGRLAVLSLDEREVEYTATWTEEYIVRVERSETFTGRRRDQDGNADRAHEIANDSDMLEEEDLISLLRDNGSHEFRDDSIDNLDWNPSDN